MNISLHRSEGSDRPGDLMTFPHPTLTTAPRRSSFPLTRLTAAIALALLASSPQAQAGASLLGYGAAAGDVALDRCDDCSAQVSLTGSGPVASLQRIAFGGSNYTSLFVNTNGLVSFNAAVPVYSGLPLPYSSTPVIAPFWADVDTRSTQSGQVWRRTVNDLPTMASLAQRIQGAMPGGSAGFTPTFAQVVTWGGVGYYAYGVDKLNTFQLVLASDGLQTYALMLYPTGAIQWDRGIVSPENTYATVGYDAGDGLNYFNVAGSRTAAVRQLDTATNTANGSTGTQIFALGSDTVAPTVYGGAAQAVQLSGNQIVNTLKMDTSGYSFRSNAAGTNRSLQLRKLEIAANHAVGFGNDMTVLAYRPDTITRGQVALTGNGVLMARAAGALNGGTVTLQSSAQLQIHTANATTAATALVFDKASAGGTGGTLDLGGFSTRIGRVSELGSGAGLITNSGASAATLRLDSASDSRFGGLIRNGNGVLSLVKAGSGSFTLAGTHSYSGTTTVEAGEFRLDGAAANSAFSVGAGAKLSGNGTVRALNVAGLLSPGQSPGTFHAGATTLTGGGSYLWELADAGAAAGTGYDLLAVTGALNIAASPTSRFTITLRSLQADQSAGNAQGFDATTDHQFTLASASGGIFGFAADRFILDASGFSNDLKGGEWSITQAGNSLNLAFTAHMAPVPEPQAWALMLAGVGCLGWLRRRRTRAA
jgi:autotransporter-associated beta strand protein